MAFIRKKKVKGRIYFQLVKNIREGDRVKQKVLKHLGNESSAKEYCRKNRINLENPIIWENPTIFFEHNKQISEFVTALRGRSEIPLKFEYLKDGAKRWDRLIHSEDYSLGIIENDLIKDNSSGILEEIQNKNVNIIDLGCGTGEKAITFLENIKKIDCKYVALDISKDMLELAESNIIKKVPNLNSEYHLVDFEEGNFAHITEELREKNYPLNLILFLGNTLGNVSDKSRVLSNIRESMTLNDHLLIGIELFDIKRIQDILKHYKGNKIWQDNIFTSLEYFGLNQEDGRFEVNFNRNKNQVEARFVIKKDKEINCISRKIKLKKDSKILLMISYKATPKDIQILLAETGFVIKRLFLNKDETYALILCKPAKL
jgi:uncharacterized SAM-dependent methyltransferase